MNTVHCQQPYTVHSTLHRVAVYSTLQSTPSCGFSQYSDITYVVAGHTADTPDHDAPHFFLK